MEELLNNDVAKELFAIIPYLEDEFVNSISDELLVKIVDLAADSDKIISIKKGKKLSDQGLSDECINLLSLLYYQTCSDEAKDELLNTWIKNDYVIKND